MKKSQNGILLQSIFILTLFFGCTSIGTIMEVPEWFSRISPNDSLIYFTGYGEEKNIEDARAEAAEYMATLILSEMGLPSYDKMIEEGKSSYQEFKKSLVDSILSDSSTVTGFKLENSLVQSEKENYCWMLASYNKTDYEEMRSTFATFFPLEQFYESEYARNAEVRLKDGDIYSAILNSFTSANLVMESGDQSAAGFYLIEILETYEKNLSALTPYAKILPKNQIAAGLGSALIELQMAGNGEFGSSAEFQVNFYVEKPDGTLVEKEFMLNADQNGMLIFNAPVFNNPGNQYISFKMSSEPFRTALGKVPNHLEDRVERFFNMIDSIQLHYGYSVVNDYRLIPTAVIVLDKDITGNVLNPPTTEAGILNVLIADGANIELLPLSPEELFKYNELELIRMLEAVYGDKYRRVIWGSSSLDRFSPEGDFYSVTANADIVVTDLITHQTVYAFSLSKTAQAVQSDVAISTVFRELGRAWAAKLIQDQP